MTLRALRGRGAVARQCLEEVEGQVCILLTISVLRLALLAPSFLLIALHLVAWLHLVE